MRDDIFECTSSSKEFTHQRPKTRRLWSCLHDDDYVELGNEVDPELCRQQVNKRFIMNRRGYVGNAAQHNGEMRIQNRVLT